MSNFICPECGKEILDSRTGYITGCPHFPAEEFTESSGKHMSDGMERIDADLLVFRQMIRQRRLF